MRSLKKYVYGLAVAGALSGLLGGAGLAATPQEVVERLQALFATEYTTMTWDAIREEGSNVIVEGVKIESTGGIVVSEQTITLENIQDGDQGAFVIGRMLINDGYFESGSDRMSFSGAEIADLYLPAEPQPSYTLAYQPYGNVRLKNFVMEAGKGVFLKGENVTAEVSEFVTGKEIKHQGRIERITFGGLPEGTIDEIGYDELSGKMSFASSTSLESGLLDLKDFSFDVDNFGKLALKMQFGGYSLDLAEAISKLSQNAGDEQALMLSFMGIAQQLTFNSFSLRFEDASITNKVLDFVASQMGGGSREDMINMAVAGVQFGLTAQVQHPDFVLKLSNAIGEYLKAPHSIEFVFAPEQPLPFMMLAGAAQDPKSLIDMLNINIKTND